MPLLNNLAIIGYSNQYKRQLQLFYLCFQWTTRYNIVNRVLPMDMFDLTVTTPVTQEILHAGCLQRTVNICTKQVQYENIELTPFRGVARDKSMCRHRFFLEGSGGIPPLENFDILYCSSCIQGHFKPFLEGKQIRNLYNKMKLTIIETFCSVFGLYISIYHFI